MFRPCSVIFRENFLLSLHWGCTLYLCENVLLTVNCVLEAWTVLGPGLQAGTTESSRLQNQRSTQSTAHSHWTIKCNLSVTITKSSPWRWPSRVETCRSVLQLMMQLPLCICWWLVFLYNIVHGHGTHQIKDVVFGGRCSCLCWKGRSWKISFLMEHSVLVGQLYGTFNTHELGFICCSQVVRHKMQWYVCM
jgi:hypothetical protein